MRSFIQTLTHQPEALGTYQPTYRALRLRHSATSYGEGCSVCVCACLFKCCHYDRQPFPLNMPSAMHLTLLLSLFAVTVSTDSTASSTTQLVADSTTSPASLTSSTAGKTQHVISPTTSDPSQQVTTAVTSGKTSSPPSTSSQIPNSTEETNTSRPTETPVITQNSTETPKTNQVSTGTPVTNKTSTGTPVTNQTSAGIPVTNQTSTGIPVTNQAVSNGSTTPPTSRSTNITVNTTVNTTSPAHEKEKGNSLATNPGLVAIICIFCIVLVLALVVAAVKCTSPRNNFERLEDVPMGKVNEGSPFAHYSK